MMDVYTMKCTQECCANWGGEAVHAGDREETSPKASRVLGVSSPITLIAGQRLVDGPRCARSWGHSLAHLRNRAMSCGPASSPTARLRGKPFPSVPREWCPVAALSAETSGTSSTWGSSVFLM